MTSHTMILIIELDEEGEDILEVQQQIEIFRTIYNYKSLIIRKQNIYYLEYNIKNKYKNDTFYFPNR